MAKKPEPEFLVQIFEAIKDNDEFLRKDAKNTYDEVVGLINDAIDFASYHAKREDSEEDYVKSSMVFFIYHTLMPFSYAIYIDLLVGNLPVCFMQLRLMLESLVKCYLSDLRYPNQNFFQKKLELLEEESKKEYQLMEEIERQLNLENRFIALWGKLSQDWIHTKGVVDKVVSAIIERSDVPAWALVIPMNYTQTDLNAINELSKRISQFRCLLKTTTKEYQRE